MPAINIPTEKSPLLHSVQRNSSHSSIQSSDEVFATSYGMNDPDKSIGPYSSFALLTNNIAGPGLMSLPLLFQKSGIVPTVLCISIMCCCSSLSATMLAETIASIPGNTEYSMNIEYSNVFDILMGNYAYYIAEIFFIMACMVQACTGLVETAQSLDSFLVSYLLGTTYGIQLYPTLNIVQWSLDHCTTKQIQFGNCIPFNDSGPLVITSGFIIVTLLFFPLGRGHLKETMIVQIISFICLSVLLFEFDIEFLTKGLVHRLPWFGTAYADLIGVVLFNYAFVITVPAWLIEKTPSTNVNKCIWSAAIFSSLLYVSFGMLAAMAYHHDTEDMLTILAGDSVHHVTKVCAALFGVTIIGAGVPVFCVIIKNTLYSTKACGAHMSFFWGSVFPYCVSWALYQGSLLMSVLNWAGLIVNGAVAFIFPLIVCRAFFSKTNSEMHEIQLTHLRISPKDHEAGTFTFDERSEPAHTQKSLPDCLVKYRLRIVEGIIVLFVVMIFTTIIYDVISGSGP